MGILIIEDDEGVREALRSILVAEGYSVDVANDGQQALDFLQRQPAPSLIMLDLIMPNMTGEEFRARQLSDERLANIPVIVISARPDGRRRAELLGAADFLAKPMSFEELLHVVQNRAVAVVTSSMLPGAPKTLREAWAMLCSVKDG